MRRRNLLLVCPTLIAALAGPARGQNSQPVPSSQVRKEFVLGQHLAEDLERRDKRIDDPAIVGYLRSIGDHLAGVAGVRSQEIRITRGSDVYANLLPQGVLYISGALLERVESEAELAGLLAHELAHEPMVSQPQALGAIPLIVPACVLSSQLAPSKSRADAREPELTATKAAVQTLRAAGYDPSAVLDLLSKLAYEHPGWAKAIVPGDLLSLRVSLEAEDPPQAGYMIDSSEFLRNKERISVALGHSRKTQTVPTLKAPAKY